MRTNYGEKLSLLTRLSLQTLNLPSNQHGDCDAYYKRFVQTELLGCVARRQKI